MDRVPKVTIGIATYNSAGTIVRAVKSALDLDWPNLDILVIDDASTDGTLELVRAIKATSAGIRFIEHSTNMGISGTRNHLVGAADGEFVAFLDHDDYAHRDRIRGQMGALLAAEARCPSRPVACFASRNVIGLDGVSRYVPAMAADGRPAFGEGVAAAMLTGERSRDYEVGRTGSTTMLARKSTFEIAAPYDPAIRRHEDLDWTISLLVAGGAVIGTAEALVDQYLTETGDKTPEIVLQSATTLIEKWRTLLVAQHAYTAARLRCSVEYLKRRGPRWKLAANLTLLLLIRPGAVSRHFTLPAGLRGKAR